MRLGRQNSVSPFQPHHLEPETEGRREAPAHAGLAPAYWRRMCRGGPCLSRPTPWPIGPPSNGAITTVTSTVRPDQYRGPYSSMTSVTLMIAREMTKENVRRRER